ncbi:MAG: DNA mismatch repair endonuclease MutL [Pirellulaceae bacterium]
MDAPVPPTIRQLPTSVVNKIAAGEVIERPASVLKELMENAVDAKSTRVEVLMEKGGTDLVRVSDNGCGIPYEQLPLTIASHATSKIEDADDLFSVHTLGFRGEALASIAEVSHFCMRSRTHQSDAGYELAVRGGQADEIVPCGCAPGTTVEVRNLFFNTPVRRKFMRSVQTEMGHCSEAFIRIAMAYNHIHFTLKHNTKTVFELPPVDNWKERILTLFGPQIADSLIHVDSSDQDIRLTGYVANPDQNRGNTKMQYLFLNGRHIRDRSLQHALGEAYRGLLLHGRYPISFLRLEIPAELVDVNVHPTKLEVRFQDGGRIYSQLLSTLRNRFLNTDLTSKVQGPEEPIPETTKRVDFISPEQQAKQKDDFMAWDRDDAKVQRADSGESTASQPVLRFDEPEPQYPLPNRAVPDFKPFDQGNVFSGVPRTITPPTGADFDPATFSQPTSTVTSPVALRTTGEVIRTEPTSPSEDAAAELQRSQPSDASGVRTDSESTGRRHLAIQAHNRYLITESEEGVVIIDQHALHERILYEEIRTKVLAGNLEVQRLLVPETVHLTPTETSAILEAKDVLADMGMEVDEFGGDTVLVSSYPAMLSKLKPGDLVRQIAERLTGEGQGLERREILDELFHMMSCKAAVKAGDRLSPAEVHALIERRHLVQDSHHCPHGRPTTLVFTREELDRRFKRI